MAKVSAEHKKYFETSVRNARDQPDIDIPRLNPNSTITGRPISLVKNEFKINIIDDKKAIYLYTVEFKPESSGPREKPLKKEDNRNIVHNIMRDIPVKIAFDGGQLCVLNMEIPRHENVREGSSDTVYISQTG